VFDDKTDVDRENNGIITTIHVLYVLSLKQ
jgi:hypothetical protein